MVKGHDRGWGGGGGGLKFIHVHQMQLLCKLWNQHQTVTSSFYIFIYVTNATCQVTCISGTHVHALINSTLKSLINIKATVMP